jgi:hypothetical protein
LVSGVLAGCGSTPDPVPSPAPAVTAVVGETAAGDELRIVWPHGEPDDGKWSQDVAVQTLRRYDLALAIVGYTHDWSSPDLAATVSRGSLERYYEADRDVARQSPEGVKPSGEGAEGPLARVIVDVVEMPEGAFIVKSCVPVGGLEGVQSGQDLRSADSTLIESLLEVEDGVLKVTDRSASRTDDPGEGLGGPCDGVLAGLRYGYFDPDPSQSGVWTLDDVVSPDGVVGAPEQP